MLILVLAVFPIVAQSQIADTTFTDIYNTVSPSVVSISVTQNVQTAGPASPNQRVSGGTGFVIDSNGYIVTNFHVVREADSIEVSFFDGTLALAKIVGLDPDSDLAVIQVEDVPSERLHPLTFGDSSTLEVGQTVLAIGSPFGERWTLTSGIISAIDRTIRGMTEFSIGGVIQTDAAINPGNSGGPLLNMQGEVIGVNSQIISGSGSNAGIGFAIPSNLTQRVAQTLIERGYVEYSYLGISGGNVNLALLEAFELPNNTRGVVVSDVVAGSPASRAGLEAMGAMIQSDSGVEAPQSLDIITAIDGTPILSMEDLISYLAQQTQPGDEAVLTILRNDSNGTQTLELTTRLTPRP
ncbi:MAG: trypsin-like peptidase domain-containing protein [Anaerolineae bacterium]|nr:trypsin-like peptidase domain-containing protein [Anaerolineae bacterium]